VKTQRIYRILVIIGGTWAILLGAGIVWWLGLGSTLFLPFYLLAVPYFIVVRRLRTRSAQGRDIWTISVLLALMYAPAAYFLYEAIRVHYY